MPLEIATLALLNALNAGVFLAFVVMVSPALRQETRADAAASVMNEINRRAPRSVFMLSFLGAPALAVYVGVRALMGPELDPWVLGSATATLVAFGVSVAVNIPWNERLRRDAGHLATWREYSRVWPRANAVRLVLSVLAFAVGLATLVG